MDGRTQFYHTNHLGSASVITDGYGNRKERMEYFPFGTYRESVDYDPSFPDVFYTFTGQEDDDDLGLYNYGARLYDPVLGRFISPDRLVPDPADPQALNRYTYCLNNPLIYTDPSGEWFWLAIAVVIGSFSGAYQAKKAGENPWKGAMLGAIIGATSYYVGGVVGFYVSELITPTVVTAANAGAVSAANIVSATAGGFAGGATAGALNAAAYGGNVWQAALYGGLMGAAIAGTIQGAIELNNWANASTPTGNMGQQSEDPLQFNGRQLTATDEKGNIVGVWDAKSGKPGSTPADQNIEWFGPIKEGNYYVDPGKIQRWEDLSWWQKLKSNLGGGQWPGGVETWGEARVPIQVPEGSTRGGYFIHSGDWSRGTAGCIKIPNQQAPSFFNYLGSQKGLVPLTVNYGR